MEEVSVLRPEGAQEIIDRWRPFNRGESSIDHFHDLYLVMLRMLVTVRVEGQGEEYTILVPARTIKEDLQRMIEDGMQVHNHNFTQLTKLVSLEALYLVLVLFLSYCHIINMFLRRRCCYSEHGLPASRISYSTEGRREAKTLHPVGVFRQKGIKCFLNGGRLKVEELGFGG